MLDQLKKLFGGGTDLRAVLEQGAVIVDVRTVGEFQSGHVKGSKNIPLDKITGKVNQIQSWNKPIITCCASGMRSGTAAKILRNQGIEAYNGGSWASVDRL